MKIGSGALFSCLITVASLVQVSAAEAEQFPRISLEELRAKYTDPQGHFAKVDGLEVYYKDEGSGPAILMIHGSESTLHTYDFVAAKLIDRYRVIRFDIPDQGLSGPVTDADIARLKINPKIGTPDIAEHLLDQLGVHSTTVTGVSAGGTMAVYLAAKRPDLVNRLILSNSPSDPTEDLDTKWTPERIAANKVLAATNYKTREYYDAFFGHKAGDVGYIAGDPSRITPAIREQYYDFNRRSDGKCLLTPKANCRIALSAKVTDHQFALDAFSRVKVPVLLLWGGLDPVLGPYWADELAKYLTQAQVSKILLADVGHYPPLEVPERYAAIVAAYIEAATPSAAPRR